MPRYRYFAVLDDHHDVEEPRTVIRVEDAEPAEVTALNDGASWVRTPLLDKIDAGEVPYRLEPITAKAATRIQKRRQRKIVYRYSILVDHHDADEVPMGVLRERDSRDGTRVYGETYTRDCEWSHSSVRLDVEEGRNDFARIIPSDSATVHQIIDSWHRRLDRQGHW